MGDKIYRPAGFVKTLSSSSSASASSSTSKPPLSLPRSTAEDSRGPRGPLHPQPRAERDRPDGKMPRREGNDTSHTDARRYDAHRCTNPTANASDKHPEQLSPFKRLNHRPACPSSCPSCTYFVFFKHLNYIKAVLSLYENKYTIEIRH
jgi:hypothetical protein